MIKKSGKINHIGLLISDLDKARVFYGNVLDLEEIERPVFEIQGIWYQLGEHELHLMLMPNMPRPPFHPKNKTVQAHFSINVHMSEYREMVDKLSLSKFEVIEEQSFRDNIEIWQAFFYDPDGNMIEILASKMPGR